MLVCWLSHVAARCSISHYCLVCALDAHMQLCRSIATINPGRNHALGARGIVEIGGGLGTTLRHLDIVGEIHLWSNVSLSSRRCWSFLQVLLITGDIRALVFIGQKGHLRPWSVRLQLCSHVHSGSGLAQVCHLRRIGSLPCCRDPVRYLPGPCATLSAPTGSSMLTCIVLPCQVLQR